MGDVAVAVMVLMAGMALRNGAFTVGDFALFSSYLFFVARFPANFGSYLSEIASQRVVLDRVQAMHPEAPPESIVEHGPIYEKSYRRDAEGLQVEILRKMTVHQLESLEIKGLTCRHQQAPVNKRQSTNNSSSISRSSYSGIFDINLALPRGSFTVITGRIGSGKTTLLRVLLGLLPLEDGEIRWNGALVTDPAAFFAPPRSAYTPQTPRLFSETLRDNILFGLSDDGRLEGAVETAVLTPDITQLENGLDTLVGPRGVRLSGGQVQRAATARMLMRDAELLVFDDLSSALDVETEALLWERLIGLQGEESAIRNPKSEITCLVVSHRRAALRQADQIVVMRDGR
ncbi:MAG: ABC transporter ATP-binding protein/permease, partial [Chloroflexi bacterium]|nr:ABC transporter ATP-binding protein/permease [Chloroflexota bacterium]